MSAVSVESRFLLACNAALSLATVALRAAGYRTSSNLPGHHAIAIASLAFTLGADARTVAVLEAFRRKRNRATYGGPEEVSEQELAELVTLATRLRAQLAAWLKARHPELAP